MRCPACNDKCRPHWLDFTDPGWRVKTAITLAGWALTWFPFATMMKLLSMGTWLWFVWLPLALMYKAFVDNVYHTWWTWRHPARCQGGGGKVAPVVVQGSHT
jgi:hypothetical protein